MHDIHYRVAQIKVEHTYMCRPVDKLLIDKKAQLSLTNPRDAKACRNCFNSACLQRCR